MRYFDRMRRCHLGKASSSVKQQAARKQTSSSLKTWGRTLQVSGRGTRKDKHTGTKKTWWLSQYSTPNDQTIINFCYLPCLFFSSLPEMTSKQVLLHVSGDPSTWNAHSYLKERSKSLEVDRKILKSLSFASILAIVALLEHIEGLKLNIMLGWNSLDTSIKTWTIFYSKCFRQQVMKSRNNVNVFSNLPFSLQCLCTHAVMMLWEHFPFFTTPYILHKFITYNSYISVPLRQRSDDLTGKRDVSLDRNGDLRAVPGEAMRHRRFICKTRSKRRTWGIFRQTFLGINWGAHKPLKLSFMRGKAKGLLLDRQIFWREQYLRGGTSGL